MGLALLRHLEGGKPIPSARYVAEQMLADRAEKISEDCSRVESGQRDFQPSHSAGGWPTRGSRESRGSLHTWYVSHRRMVQRRGSSRISRLFIHRKANCRYSTSYRLK